jgi:hypothetical protein
MQSQNLVINERKKGRRFPPLVSSHLVRPQKAFFAMGSAPSF